MGECTYIYYEIYKYIIKNLKEHAYDNFNINDFGGINHHMEEFKNKYGEIVQRRIAADSTGKPAPFSVGDL